MFPEEMTMYCTICGGPIVEPGTWVFARNTWLEQAVLLYCTQNSDVLDLPAENIGGAHFRLLQTSERVIACNIEVRSPFVHPKPPLYLPCHANCIAIAKQVISSASNGREEAELLRHIWRVLKLRFDTTSVGRQIPLTNLYEPNSYYGIWKFQEMEWEPGQSGSEHNYEAQHFEADPVHIPEMIESVLSHLQYLPATISFSSSTSPNEGLAPFLLPVPSEIIEHIVKYLVPLSDPPLQCTFLLAPFYWRQALLDGLVLPWFPDFDPITVTNKDEDNSQQTAGGGNQQWNWELLVRQLAQTNLHQPRNGLNPIPLGLRNRRRIWRLVEDILSASIVTS